MDVRRDFEGFGHLLAFRPSASPKVSHPPRLRMSSPLTTLVTAAQKGRLCIKGKEKGQIGAIAHSMGAKVVSSDKSHPCPAIQELLPRAIR